MNSNKIMLTWYKSNSEMNFIITHCKGIDSAIYDALIILFVDHLGNNMKRGKSANLIKSNRKFLAFLVRM